MLERDARHQGSAPPHVPGMPRPHDDSLTAQVTSWSWTGFTPHLRCRHRDGTTSQLRLDGALELEVLPERTCTGRIRADRWSPCPRRRQVARFAQCPDCHPLPDPECVFEPRCADCTQPFCTNPHLVYLAMHGRHAKIGMTSADRVPERLIEQGADAYAILAHTPDRFTVRRMEDALSRALRVPQTYPRRALAAAAARPIPTTAVAAHAQDLIGRAGRLHATPASSLTWLTEYPGTWPLPATPAIAHPVGRHQGRVIACKGPFVFLRETPHAPIWALDASALVGHHIRFPSQAAKADPSSRAPPWTDHGDEAAADPDSLQSQP